MINTLDYLQFDPKKKNHDWMTRLISQFRMTAYRPLYDANKARLNREIINSTQSMEKIKLMFKDVSKLEELGFEFIPLMVMEKIKNILCGEKMKSEIKAYVYAKDPALQRLKKEDENLLKNKKLIDGAVNSIQKSIGLPPKEIGNEDFHGNYADYSAMGFEDGSDMDIETFFDTFYQLDTEMDFQKIINHVFSVNSVEDYTYDFMEDLMAIKTLAVQLYVNQLTGGMTFRRLIPENVFRIKGEKNTNQKSDVAVGYYESVTVSEFLKRAGDNFDFVEQLEWMLAGVNYSNPGLRLTGIQLENGNIWGEKTTVCTYTEILNYKVELGYIEFKSFDSDKYKEFQNKLGNTKVYEIDENEITQKKYIEHADYRERTYHAYFLVTAAFDQYVFNGGLLYHQETEGQEDEYANFSIKYVREGGKSIAEVARPWVTIIQEAFMKFRWLLRDAKKDGRSYNLESLKKVSLAFNNNDGSSATLKQTLEMLKESADEIWAFPDDGEGDLMSVQNTLNYDKPNNFDVKLKSFTEIIEWGVQGIKKDIGINDFREGASPSTNDVAKLEIASGEMSMKTTHYLNNMLDYIYRNTGVSILNFTMDIIRYKASLPYKYLKTVIGEEGCARLDALPMISPQREDIFVTSASNYQDRQIVQRDTSLAFQKGVIDYSSKMLIDRIEDPRKAMKLLAIKEAKAKKLLAEQKAGEQKFAMDMQKQKTADEVLKINTKGQWELRKAQVQSEGFIRASQINADAKGQVEDKKTQSENNKILLEHQIEQQEQFNNA